jgi:hypothetical protein
MSAYGFRFHNAKLVNTNQLYHSSNCVTDLTVRYPVSGKKSELKI